MRSSCRIASSSALALLAASASYIASAEPVVVIRGSEVSVVAGREGDAWEERPVVVPGAQRERSIEPPSAAAVAQTPPVVLVVVVVDARALPEVAWGFVNPWKERGIRVHGLGRREASKTVTHRGLAPPPTLQIRLHGRSERAIAAIGLGGGESHIKVHRMGARAPSRIHIAGGK